jgi:hypothetical protein
MSRPDKQKLVDKRRARRKLKAAVSIGLALAAGAFLACQRGVVEVQKAVDAARGDSPDSSATSDPTEDAGIIVTDAGGDAAGGDAAGGAALDGPVDARANALSKRAPDKKDAAVDIHEHRKGMPVRDNLLE